MPARHFSSPTGRLISISWCATNSNTTMVEEEGKSAEPHRYLALKQTHEVAPRHSSKWSWLCARSFLQEYRLWKRKTNFRSTKCWIESGIHRDQAESASCFPDIKRKVGQPTRFWSRDRPRVRDTCKLGKLLHGAKRPFPTASYGAKKTSRTLPNYIV